MDNHSSRSIDRPPPIATNEEYDRENQKVLRDPASSPNLWTKFNTVKTIDKPIVESIYSEEEEPVELDPFVPFPEEQEVEEHILTVRAVVIGCALGALVNASNLYLGLKTGWTFSANLVGAIFGFAVCRFLSRVFAENFPILGGKFGPKENSIIQTSATAAGGLSNLFVAAIPALYQLNLLGERPRDDLPRLLTFTSVSAYYGLFFATPLRKFFILHVARELNLIFPTATATAMTIQNMHTFGHGDKSAMRRVKYMSFAFIGAVALRVFSQYAPGILWDWHIFTWIFVAGNYNNLAIQAESFGWLIEWTPAFIGSGMLVGLNSALSFFGGSVLGWGVIAPILVSKKICVGTPHLSATDLQAHPQWKGWMDYTKMNFTQVEHEGANILLPSPRYWLLWPGVAVMLLSSVTELAIQYRLIWFALKSAVKGFAYSINYVLHFLGYGSAWLERQSRLSRSEEMIEDPAPKKDQISTVVMLPATIVVVILTCAILTLQYHMSLELSLLSILLGFLFAFLAIQCTGATDVTPLTVTAKGTQLITGGAAKFSSVPMGERQLTTLVGGAIAIGAASQATDLTVDFRVGYLLRTPPKLQWAAQAIGSFFAIFMSVGVFVLFTSAYPCILQQSAHGTNTCMFGAPAAAAWVAVTQAVTSPKFPAPHSSGWFSLIMGTLAVFSVLLRHYYFVGPRLRYRSYVPNFMAIGLAFISQTVFSTAMVMGSVIAFLWARYHQKSYQTLCFSVAAGMIAGEGIGGVINAALAVVNVGQSTGTRVGCPGIHLNSCRS